MEVWLSQLDKSNNKIQQLRASTSAKCKDSCAILHLFLLYKLKMHIETVRLEAQTFQSLPQLFWTEETQK